MNAKLIGAGATLVAFSAFSAYVVYQYGYIGLFEQALTNAATLQVLLDLIIALSFVLAWMWNDARERGISIVPYVLLTLTLGSIGPLLYLVRRYSKDSPMLTDAQVARS